MHRHKSIWGTLIVVLILGLAFNGPVTTNVAATNPVNPDEGQEPESALGSSPVMFIENVGQFAEGARFQARGSDRTIWLADDSIWVTLMEPGPAPVRPDDAFAPPRYPGDRDEGRAERDETRAVAIRLTFDGANPDPALKAFGRLETSLNYFIGNEPANWQTNVPVWSGVRYSNLYPGVDLVVGTEVAATQDRESQGSALPWRLEAREGTDLSAIRLRIEGTDAVQLLPAADIGRGAGGEGLQLTTGVGEFTLPLLRVTGADTLEYPRPRFSNNMVISPFAATSSDAARSGIANPQSASDLLYGTLLGGGENDNSYDIAVDGFGNAYVTGYTRSSDFPATPGAYDTTLNSDEYYDVFVAKLSPDLSTVAYATFLGGSEANWGDGIAVDGSGHAYVTGWTSSSNFPTTPGAYDTTFNGGLSDAFVAKLSPDGSSLAYATFLGGSDLDNGNGIAVDGSGEAYVTGWTLSSEFPATTGAYGTAYKGNGDAFVVRLSPDGSSLVYATFLGGNDRDIGYDIALDVSGQAYVTGNTRSSDFPATTGAYDTTFNGGFFDAFVAKLSPDGSTLAYATFLGGSSWDQGYGIAISGSGEAYVTGRTDSSDFPTTSESFDTIHNGGRDAFVAKLSPDGSTLAYATFLGGSDLDEGYDIAVDRSGHAHVTGRTRSSDFPTTAGGYDTTLDYRDAFVAKLSPDGSTLAYATFLGGSSWDLGYGIALDGIGNAYVTGYTGSSDFPTTPGAFDRTHNGGADAFVVKLAMGEGMEVYLPLVVANR